MAITFWLYWILLESIRQKNVCLQGTEHSIDALMPNLEPFCTFSPLKRKFYLFNAGLIPGTTNVKVKIKSFEQEDWGFMVHDIASFKHIEFCRRN